MRARTEVWVITYDIPGDIPEKSTVRLKIHRGLRKLEEEGFYFDRPQKSVIIAYDEETAKAVVRLLRGVGAYVISYVGVRWW